MRTTQLVVAIAIVSTFVAAMVIGMGLTANTRDVEAAKPIPVLVYDWAVAPGGNADDVKTGVVVCPEGTVVRGGGAFISVHPIVDSIALRQSHPLRDLSGWAATAYETSPTDVDWNLRVDAVCERP